MSPLHICAHIVGASPEDLQEIARILCAEAPDQAYALGLAIVKTNPCKLEEDPNWNNRPQTVRLVSAAETGRAALLLRSLLKVDLSAALDSARKLNRGEPIDLPCTYTHAEVEEIKKLCTEHGVGMNRAIDRAYPRFTQRPLSSNFTPVAA